MKCRLLPPLRAGLTRIEVIVLCIAVFTMLALLFPFLLSLRYDDSGHNRTRCVNNMRNISLAMSNMATAHNYPAAKHTNEEGEIQFGWRIAVLPYMEQDPMYHEIRENLPWDSEYNRQFEDTMPSLFRCPTFPGLMSRRTSYQVVVGPETPFEGSRRTGMDDFERGLSNTILMVETTQGVPWMSPTDLPYANLDHGIVPLRAAGKSAENWSVGSAHASNAVVAMADGSVRMLDFSRAPGDVTILKTLALLKNPKTESQHPVDTEENGPLQETPAL